MEIVKRKLSEIIPYPNNPRKNDAAVAAVAESIKQCGYCAPIIVDEDGVILAGHTRLKALKKLGWKEAEVVIRDGLTEEQKKKYRLLDNKTGELAEWDFNALALEIEAVDFGGFDFGFDVATLQEGYGESFEIASGARDGVVQMTFTLSQEQSELIKTALQTVKGEITETFGNENGNGNALYEVVKQWTEQRG